MKITDTTALNVLVRNGKNGATESDLFHSKIYLVRETIDRLRQKGYRIQERAATTPMNAKEIRYFVDIEQVRERALIRRGKSG